MSLRFCSWVGALEQAQAGLPAIPRSGSREEFSEADAVAAVVECCRQTGAPTVAACDKWQEGQAGKASAATVKAGTGIPTLSHHMVGSAQASCTGAE
jgi:nicotinamidase-related amidase